MTKFLHKQQSDKYGVSVQSTVNAHTVMLGLILTIVLFAVVYQFAELDRHLLGFQPDSLTAYNWIGVQVMLVPVQPLSFHYPLNIHTNTIAVINEVVPSNLQTVDDTISIGLMA